MEADSYSRGFNNSVALQRGRTVAWHEYFFRQRHGSGSKTPDRHGGKGCVAAWRTSGGEPPLRGGHQVENRLTALLYYDGKKEFFSSENTEGWQKHGVGGTLSAAIATRLAFGDTLKDAISRAHDYMHAQVVYGVKAEPTAINKSEKTLQRKADIYNEFTTLVAQHYREAHDVAFYADKLAITTRYLSRVTTDVVGYPPKQLIFNYIMQEACSLLKTSRLSLGEISAHLGFSNESRFVAFFKNQHGVSPGVWRKR